MSDFTASLPRANWRSRLPLAGVLGTAVLLGSVSLIYPFARDHGIFAFIADSALHGKVMYRDILMGVLPMTVVVHELAMIMFGRSMAALRILDLLWTMATAALVFAFVRRAWSRVWLAMTAGMMYSFLYYLFDFWNTAQSDGFLNLPVAAAFVLVAVVRTPKPGVDERRGGIVSFLAGLLIALSLLFKSTIGLLVPGLAVFVLFGGRHGDSGPAWNWRRFAMFAAGVLVALSSAVAVMLVGHSWSGFIEGQMRIALPYSRMSSADDGLLVRAVHVVVRLFTEPGLRIGAGIGALGFVLAVSGLAGSSERCHFPLPVALVLMWLGAALASVYVQGKFFFYHYLPLLPPLAILGALALVAFHDWVATRLARGTPRLLLFAAIAAGLLVSTGYPVRFLNLGHVVLGGASRNDYWFSDIHDTPGFSLGEQMTIADYVRKRTAPTDRVFVWGVDPLVNLLAQRPTVSRFIYNHPLAATWAWPGYRTELMHALEADTAAIFITEHDDATPWVTGNGRDSYEALMAFPKLRDFVVANYELETRVGRFDILRRAGPDSSYPQISYQTGPLAEDLNEAVHFVAQLDTASYKSLFWPGSEDAPLALRAVATRLHGYRELARSLWLGERKLPDVLPAVSIWIRNDPRPFASLDPFRFQSLAESYVCENYYFELLHGCRNKRVLIYRVAARTGIEPLKQNGQRGD